MTDLPPVILKLMEKGKCYQCGRCCRSPPTVTKQEAMNIAKHLCIELDEFKQKYLRFIPDHDIWMLNKTGPYNTNVCVFLRSTRSDGKLLEINEIKINQSACTIHGFKPLICEVQFCGFTKEEKLQLYRELKLFIQRNVDYHWD